MTFRFKPEDILIPSEDLKVDLYLLEGLCLPIIIIENFYKFPDRVRELIQRLPHPIWKRHPRETKNFIEYMDCRTRFDTFWYGYSYKIADIVRYTWDIEVERQHDIVTNNFLAIQPHPEGSIPHPHSDSWNVVATVIYLNLSNESSGGTAFYLNKQLNITHAADDPEHYLDQLKKIHVDDNIEDGRDYFLQGPKRYWELMDMIPMEYNRAIVYPGLYFHGALHKAGSWQAYPRLNQVLFQRVLQPAKGWFKHLLHHFSVNYKTISTGPRVVF